MTQLSNALNQLSMQPQSQIRGNQNTSVMDSIMNMDISGVINNNNNLNNTMGMMGMNSLNNLGMNMGMNMNYMNMMMGNPMNNQNMMNMMMMNNMMNNRSMMSNSKPDPFANLT